MHPYTALSYNITEKCVNKHRRFERSGCLFVQGKAVSLNEGKNTKVVQKVGNYQSTRHNIPEDESFK